MGGSSLTAEQGLAGTPSHKPAIVRKEVNGLAQRKSDHRFGNIRFVKSGDRRGADIIYTEDVDYPGYSRLTRPS